MKLILPLINKLKRKRLLINRASESYKKASHIGILYSYIDENKQRAINEFVEKLKKDGKKVDLLPSIKNKNDAKIKANQLMVLHSQDIRKITLKLQLCVIIDLQK